MRELWWKIIGYSRIRITGADLERTLRIASARVRLERMDFLTSLTVECSVSALDLDCMKDIADRNGDKLEVLSRQGFPAVIHRWIRIPVITATVLFLLVLSIALSDRILFIKVQGNLSVPARLILEEASASGLSFGSSREGLRSEQLKNELLSRIPELSWVGVNTEGCVAIISVRERHLEVKPDEGLPGNIVSCADAVVTEITANRGTPLCAAGSAVRKGQVLISGFTDLGLCTHVESAEGEVYGRTRRKIRAVIPEITRIPAEYEGTENKYSILLGKKRINFYSDSGILHPGCGKMTQIRYLELPGGWTLPVALIVDTYTVSTFRDISRWEQDAADVLRNVSDDWVNASMIAGEILQSDFSWTLEDGCYSSESVYECREMIGRRSSGILTEGDIHYDGEND